MTGWPLNWQAPCPASGSAARATLPWPMITARPSVWRFQTSANRECHQQTGREAGVCIGGFGGDAIEERVCGDPVNARVRSCCDGGVSDPGDRGQVVDTSVGEPRALPAQATERRQYGVMTFEVIEAHPVKDGQHDETRSDRGWLEDRPQRPSGDGTGHGRSEKRGQRRRHVLLADWFRERPRADERRAVEEKWYAAVVIPRAAMHVTHRRIAPGDEMAFLRDHDDLTGASGVIRAGDPLEEGLPELP